MLDRAGHRASGPGALLGRHVDCGVGRRGAEVPVDEEAAPRALVPDDVARADVPVERPALCDGATVACGALSVAHTLWDEGWAAYLGARPAGSRADACPTCTAREGRRAFPRGDGVRAGGTRLQDVAGQQSASSP